MDMRRLVGRNVRRARERAGLSQEQLAVRAGVSQQYVSTVENGRRNVTVVSLYILAQQMNATPVELLTPDDEALTEAPGAPERVNARAKNQARD